MRNILFLFTAVIFAAIGTVAQESRTTGQGSDMTITVVDSEGNAIPLASVLREDGRIIGTTGLDGRLDNVKDAAKVVVTHVAYKPQSVSLASLQNGRIVMESLDYGLDEIVVKPKQYIYVETYYRAYVYRNDSLVYFKCCIMPNAYDPKKKKAEHGSSQQAYAEFAPTMWFAVNWGARVDEWHAGRVGTNGFPTDASMKEKYMVTIADDGQAGKVYSNTDGIVGHLVNSNSQAILTLDAGKMQMFANKVKGQTKALNRREEKGYKYKFTLIHNRVEDSEYDLTNFAMKSDHWEYIDKKSQVTIVIETYATEHGFMDKDEFKAKKNEIKEEYKSTTLDNLETRAASYGIPALPPSMLKAIRLLKRW